MKKIKWGALLLCVLCAAGLCLLPLFLKQHEEAPEETDETQTLPQKDETQRETAETTVPKEELPSQVQLPTQKVNGEKILAFPCTIEGYGLELLKLDSYQGPFVEDGTNRQISSVAMLLVKNGGDTPVEYAVIRISCGGETLEFSVSALPAGESVLVQEKTGKALPKAKPLAGEATVIPRAGLEMNEKSVSVKDNGNSSLTITNLTKDTLSSVRVFYKYYKEGVYVGGIAFNLHVTDLEAGKSVTVKPAHFISGECRVVMVQI